MNHLFDFTPFFDCLFTSIDGQFDPFRHHHDRLPVAGPCSSLSFVDGLQPFTFTHIIVQNPCCYAFFHLTSHLSCHVCCLFWSRAFLFRPTHKPIIKTFGPCRVVLVYCMQTTNTEVSTVNRFWALFAFSAQSFCQTVSDVCIIIVTLIFYILAITHTTWHSIFSSVRLRLLLDHFTLMPPFATFWRTSIYFQAWHTIDVI